MEERERVLLDNLKLVRWFVRKNPRGSRLAGGQEEFFGDLLPAYVEGVDEWLKSDRSLGVSTYVVNMLGWKLERLLLEYRFIKVRNPSKKLSEEINGHKRLILQLLKRVVHFHGGEGRCTDSALSVPAEQAEGLVAEDLARTIRKVLGTLDKRERKILELRWGLTGFRKLTLEEVGKLWKITRERVRQLEERALSKLRQPSRKKALEEFLYER